LLAPSGWLPALDPLPSALGVTGSAMAPGLESRS
jgi:hypothetical protein